MSEWISVEHELPKDWGRFLCCIEYANGEKEVLSLWFRNDIWWCHSFMYPEVTHWMPLPAPPDKEQFKAAERIVDEDLPSVVKRQAR